MILDRSRFFMSTVDHAEFEPEAMQSMIDALATTGRVLRLSDRHPGLALVATRKVVQLAKDVAGLPRRANSGHELSRR